MTIERALELLPQMRDSEWITVVGQATAIYTDEAKEAFNMAISALEKQEQANTQSVNSTHTSRPNALESLNILEQAKDDKGCVPMSLVRQAFRNILEQDKWISCKERLPENKKKVLVSYDTEDGKKVDVSMFDKYGCLLGLVSAWRPLPEPYTEGES